MPNLIRALAAEREPGYSNDLDHSRTNPTPWEEVYSKLCHQYSVYSATYAAFPHIVEIAKADGLAKQRETLMLAGTIRVHGNADEEIPKDLIEDFEMAMVKVRRWSLPVVRQAELTDRFVLPCLLQSFGGLRYPQSVYVRCLDRLSEGDSEVEIDHCPQCDNYMLVSIDEDGPTTMLLDARGHLIEKSAKLTIADRSAYTERRARGKVPLQDSEDPSWPEPETGNVLAALALERNDFELATRILDLDSTIICPHCGRSFRLADGIDS